jgi:hypothetical protein
MQRVPLTAATASLLATVLLLFVAIHCEYTVHFKMITGTVRDGNQRGNQVLERTCCPGAFQDVS